MNQGVIWPNLLIHSALAVIAVGCGVCIVATGAVVGLDVIPQSWVNSPLRTPVLVGECVLFACFALWLFFFASL